MLDEVMVGFGRTGPMWGLEHYPGVVPDILTSAKGLTASLVPMAMVGVRQHIKDHFEATSVRRREGGIRCPPPPVESQAWSLSGPISRRRCHHPLL